MHGGVPAVVLDFGPLLGGPAGAFAAAFGHPRACVDIADFDYFDYFDFRNRHFLEINIPPLIKATCRHPPQNRLSNIQFFSRSLLPLLP
jgi:hypothetical protein